MHRVLISLVVLCLAAFVLAAPATVEAKPPGRPNPKPTPTVQPTPPVSTPTPIPSPSPTPTTVDGIDVSYHQGSIDWGQVAAAGKRFAFIRASAGTLTADSAYWTNRAGAGVAGLSVGSYHFANPDTAVNDASNEASWFLRNSTIVSGDLIPVLDLEVSNGLDPASLTVWAQTWLTQVSATTGVRPMIYTNPNFWSSSMANTDWFARNGYPVLWIAHWTTATAPAVPAGYWGGSGWTFWQQSGTGFVPGISGRVDLDRFNGSSLPPSLFVP
ncbi:MAG TPA: GH25 family lysozyme [Candidatus Limnocylindrales bacterium]|nr:GH25 family lysozyme [Candidatus Limnocylindrales bacterium]